MPVAEGTVLISEDAFTNVNVRSRTPQCYKFCPGDDATVALTPAKITLISPCSVVYFRLASTRLWAIRGGRGFDA